MLKSSTLWQYFFGNGIKSHKKFVIYFLKIANVAAVAKIGKGVVFTVCDPCFYNEYTDGRKLPPDFQNYGAAEDLVKWAIAQTK